MSKVYSNVMPEPYWIRTIKDGVVLVRLRKNIVQTEKELDEGKIETVFTYDEVEISIPLQPNLSSFIETNFDDLWLVDRFKQIEKFKSLEEESLMLMLASAETFEQMYQENQSLMLAVAETYELLMELKLGGIE